MSLPLEVYSILVVDQRSVSDEVSVVENIEQMLYTDRSLVSDIALDDSAKSSWSQPTDEAFTTHLADYAFSSQLLHGTDKYIIQEVRWSLFDVQEYWEYILQCQILSVLLAMMVYLL